MGIILRHGILGQGYLFSPEAGLVSYYKLDGSGEDYIGSLDMTSETNIDWTYAGIDVSCATYNESMTSGLKTDAGDQIMLDSDDSFSYSLWFKRDSSTEWPDPFTPPNSIPLIHNGNTSAAEEAFWIRVEGAVGQNLAVCLSHDFAQSPKQTLKVFAGQIPQDTAWHHLVVTYNGTQASTGLHIYLDNTEKSFSVSKDNITGLSIIGENGFLGIGYQYSGERWWGKIDEVSIWNKVLSKEEVETLWNSGNGSFLFPG